MKSKITFLLMTFLLGMLLSANAQNTIESSTMIFQGSLAPDGDGSYTGTIPMANEAELNIGDNEAGFDVYARNGAKATYDKAGSGTDYACGAVSDHDAYTTAGGWGTFYDPDCADYDHYQLRFENNNWYLEYHVNGTAHANPMSGTINWTLRYASETGVGAYYSGMGTPESNGYALNNNCTEQNSGVAAWDMDWSWGSEYIPLEYPGFDVNIETIGSEYRITLTPAASSSMEFQGTLTNNGSGEYSGTIMLTQAFDNYAMVGSTVVSTASSINGQQVGSDHDAYPNWNPDVPDLTYYALHLDGANDTWELQYLNTPGNPNSGAVYTPLSGAVFWTSDYVSEEGQNWSENWSWGPEDIKYAFPGFELDITDNGGENYTVKLIPAAAPAATGVVPAGPVVNNNTGESYGTIQSAINAATAGDVIELAEGTYEFTTQMNIDKDGISIEGQGNVIFQANNASWSTVNGYKHLIGIYAGNEANPVTISNITMNCNSQCFGVNTYNNAYGVLNNVTINGGKGAGLTVNGSTIVATNLNTSTNAWGAVNVDPGSGVTTPSVFTLNSGTLAENTQIWSDGTNVSGSATVTVNATGYNEYNVGIGKIWTNRALTNCATITKAGETTIYATIQAAIDAANAGDVIEVAAGTYNENVITDKRLTIQGAGETTIISGSAGVVLQLAAGIDAANRMIVKNIKVTGGTTGLTAGSYTTLENVISEFNTSYGINLNPLTDLVITNCSFNSNGSGLKLASTSSASYITITGSHFDNNTQHGWYSDASSSVEPDLDNVNITNTTFSGNAMKGFYTERLSNATFNNVTVNNSGSTVYDWGAGIDINLKWKDYSNITIQNSTITNCGIGALNGVGATIKARDDASSYNSNPATLTNVTIDNVIFTGNKNGLNFGEPGKDNNCPANVQVKNSTFSNVMMDMNNFSKANIDALTANTFNVAANNFAIEDRIYHKLDNSVKGLVTWVANNVYVTTNSGSIQRGIDATTAGWTVNVNDGTYTEQLHITTNNLTIQGVDVETVIVKSPENLTQFYNSGSNNNYPVVFVDGGNGCTLKNLTVDGDNQGDNNYRFQGIGYWNAGGTMQNMNVINIMNSTFSGAQHGVGVYTYYNIAGPYTFNIDNVDVEDFQKNAFAINGDNLTITMTNCDVVGAGQTDVTAQNGIQIWGNGTTATLTDCTIDGIWYTGESWAASGFLNYYANVTLTNVDVTNSDYSNYNYFGGTVNYTNCDVNNTYRGFYNKGGATVNHTVCTVTGSESTSYYNSQQATITMDGCSVSNPGGDGFYAWSYPNSKTLNPKEKEASPFGEGSKPDNGKGTGVDNITVSITNSNFTGTGAADSWGISIISKDGGVATATLSQNHLDSWDYPIYACDFGSGTGTINITANYNKITNYTGGFGNTADETQHGTLNYWDACPSFSGEVEVYPYYTEVSGTAGSLVFGSQIDNIVAKADGSTGTINICEGQTVLLTAEGGANYTWDNGLGAGSSKIVTPTVNTTYTVTGEDANGCALAYASVTVNVSPAPTVTITGPTVAKIGDIVELTATGATTYYWSGATAQQGQPDKAKVTLKGPGSVTVSVVGSNTGSCSGYDTHTITAAYVNAGPNVWNCAGEEVTLTAHVEGLENPTFTWTPGSLSGSSVSVSPESTTIYTVEATDGTITVTDEVTVFVYPKPVADAGPDQILAGGQATLQGSASGGTAPYSYAWTGPESFTSSDQNPVVNAEGTYTLVVTDAFGCESDADDVQVEATQAGTYTVSGNVSYAYGVVNEQMHDVEIELWSGGELKYEGSTAATGPGDYSMPNVVPGTYNVFLYSPKPWGGVTSADVIAINNHVRQRTGWILNGIKLLAADVVDNSTSATILNNDRLLVNQRRVNPGNSGLFAATGDWVFTKAEEMEQTGSTYYYSHAGSTPFSNIEITVTNADLVQDFVSLVYGDVNASYTGLKILEIEGPMVYDGTEGDWLELMNYPNPFAGNTTIRFYQPVEGNVTLEIFDFTGNKVKTIQHSSGIEGEHEISFSAQDMTPGVYMITLTLHTSDDILKQTAKMIITR